MAKVVPKWLLSVPQYNVRSLPPHLRFVFITRNHETCSLKEVQSMKERCPLMIQAWHGVIQVQVKGDVKPVIESYSISKSVIAKLI